MATLEYPTLDGGYVRLEPMTKSHIEPFVAATMGDAELYRWSTVPMTVGAAKNYVDAALVAREAAAALPFATIRKSDGVVIGSSRLFDLEHWSWPEGHPRHGRTAPDVCEIGYSWLSPTAIRTLANTEAKLLMLAHAFETWGALRVCFHTDVRNARSRAALERIGAKLEGELRTHRLVVGNAPRDSARYSIIAEEWPEVKAKLVLMAS